MSHRWRTAIQIAGVTAGLALVWLTSSGSGDVAGQTSKTAATKPITAQNYLWRPVAVGGGGFITGYSTNASGDTRVVRSDVYGAYVWQPTLDRWTQVVTSVAMPTGDRVQDGMNEGVYEIVVAPGDADRLYMAVKGRVYRSDNRGKTWRRPPDTPFPLSFDPNSEFRHYGPFLSVSPIDRNLLFLGTPLNGLWRSDDAGTSWVRVTSVPPVRDLRPATGIQGPGVVTWFEEGPSAQFTGRIWAMSAGNPVMVSSDDGVSFVALSAVGQLQPTNLKQGAFAPDGTFFGVDAEGWAVWRYRNKTWSRLSGAGLAPQWKLATTAVNPRNGDIYVFDEGGSGFRSRDGGTSWQWLIHRSRAGAGDPPWLRISDQPYIATSSITFDPVVLDRMWLAAGTGVYFADVSSTDYQINWISQTRGIEELVTNDVIQPPGESPLFAAADFGIHLKEDLNEFSTTFGPRERVLIAAQQLDWSPSNPNFIVTNASDTRTFCCSEDGNAVMAGYSVDGGRSWSKFQTLPTPPGTSGTDPWRMSFGTIAVSSGNVDNIVWAPSYNRSPFYTMNRGQTWTRVVLPGEILPYTGSHENLWIQRKTLAADRMRSGVFYLAHSGDGANAALRGVWRTTNGGANWDRVFNGEIAPNSRWAAKLRAVPGMAGHLFFTSGVAGDGDTYLRRTQDGGSLWQILSTVNRVDDVAFGKAAPGASYPTIFLSGRVKGQYGIWRSIDNAATWTRVANFPLGTLDQVTAIEADKDTFGRVYVGYQGSGWLYGEPSTCTAETYRQTANRDCIALN